MKKTALAVALGLFATTASADAFFYAGANVGQGTIDSDKSTVYGFHVGTGILPFIGVEAGYQTLSKTPDATTIYLAAKPSVDLGPIQVYAKAGIHSWSADVTSSIDDKDTDLMFGFGAEYYLIDNLSVGASWMQYQMGGDYIKDNSDQVSLTATFHFL
ncbi:porin family protein [Vibrio sp. SCSIO 43136]|uniref:porin family protein n=1 Tax=Vibrio sp. SCSIO 43136 TaxID=2819101 RepID=UPI0020751DF2|nr:porin family protein [Vibrio sp. SCSIO 43136]USD66459.1 porin family protein [Vibrio sp. SCSIO 43136]